MKILLSLIVIAMCYYSFSYGVYLWKNENSKLAGFGVLLITFMGVVIPIVVIYTRI